MVKMLGKVATALFVGFASVSLVSSQSTATQGSAKQTKAEKKQAKAAQRDKTGATSNEAVKQEQAARQPCTAGAGVERASGAADKPANERERLHLRAVDLLANGYWHEGGRVLEDLSIRYPHDLLALQAGHQVDFFTGRSRMLRDRIARAESHWQAGMPGYHAVLSMLAFGLEETADYATAERLGRRHLRGSARQPRRSFQDRPLERPADRHPGERAFLAGGSGGLAKFFHSS